jgi:hypothetical protein
VFQFSLDRIFKVWVLLTCWVIWVFARRVAEFFSVETLLAFFIS